MDERSRRVGRNEALFRQVNEEIETLERGLAGIADQTLHIVCECGDLRCQERIAVPVRKYEETRSESALFLVIPGHEIPSTEDVLERTQRFNVVRKREGRPAQIAAATDPRG
jgi:hypothetical protein